MKSRADKYEANAAFGRFVRSSTAPLDYFEYQHRATLLARLRNMFVRSAMSYGLTARQARRHSKKVFINWDRMNEVKSFILKGDGTLIVDRKLSPNADDAR